MTVFLSFVFHTSNTPNRVGLIMRLQSILRIGKYPKLQVLLSLMQEILDLFQISMIRFWYRILKIH